MTSLWHANVALEFGPCGRILDGSAMIVSHTYFFREKKKTYKTSSWFSVIFILLFNGVKILDCRLSISFSVCWGVLTVLWQALTRGWFLYHANLTWFSVLLFWDILRPKSVSLSFAKKTFRTEQQTNQKIDHSNSSSLKAEP